ncbi:MAG: putative lipoprotein [Myxococcaceae bacterium]|nr:putative lipoprotein [Myxococcaceae bacterium]
MKRHWLREKLVFIVTLAGAAAATTATGCSSVTGADCPHTVTDRSFKAQIDSNTACSLAGYSASAFNSGNGYVYARQACQSACNDSAVTECSLPPNYFTDYTAANADADAGATEDGGTPAPTCPALRDGLTAIPLTCLVTHSEGESGSGCPVEGRRPAGWTFASVSPSPSALAAYFAECAELEAASVFAFEFLASDLAANGAPEDLIASARASAKDEIRHAKVTRRLAERFGGTVRAPHAEPHAGRSLYEIALENAIEGVVRETFGAAVALWRADHAEDPAVRRAMRAIADDECNHAVLSWRIADWARSRLDLRDQTRLNLAVTDEIARMRAAVALDPAPELSSRAGVPTAAQAAALLDGLEANVWAAA